MFKAGTSGNPAGRPKGIQDRRTKYRDLLEAQAPEIIAAAIRAALAGDGQALRVCIDRICPSLRPVTQPEPINVDLSGSPVEQSQAVLKAVTDGVLAIDEATQLLAGIASSMKILELTDLQQRIEILEAATSGR